MKYLLTGGSGRLGTELQKYFDCYAPSSEELDLLWPSSKIIKKGKDCDAIIHCGGFTDVVKAEKEHTMCYLINYVGTKKLVKAFSSKRFIYISSEYCYNPVNYYAKTKLWAEDLVKKYCSNYLIIRTSFVTRPFPHERAFTDQQTRGDYLDVIAPMIVKEIKKGTTGTVDIGTSRKTMFELARQTKPDIKGISVDDIKGVKLPKDYM